MSNTPHTAAFGLTVSPVKGPATENSNHTVMVYDQGKTPLTVTMSAQEIVRNQSGKCEVNPHAASWATISPVHFTLQPGKDQTTTLHILAGASPGSHDLAAWATTPTGTVQQGGATIHTDGALGSQFLVKVPGTVPLTAPKPCVSIAAPPKVSSSLLTPTTLAAGVSGLFLVLLLVAVFVRRSYTRRQA
jgi:hypothetical protein